MSRGPFRPYSVRSARTLASYLASQYHPEKGLCPTSSFDQENVSVSEPKRKNKGAKIERKEPQSASGASSSPELSPVSQTQPSTDGTPSGPKGKAKVVVENGAVKSEETRYEKTDSINEPPNWENFEQCDHVQEKIDQKSFTQNLFSTDRIGLLHTLFIPYEEPPELSSSAKTTEQGYTSTITSSPPSAVIPNGACSTSRNHVELKPDSDSRAAPNQIIPPTDPPKEDPLGLFKFRRTRKPRKQPPIMNYPLSHFNFGNIWELRGMSQQDDRQLLDSHLLLRQMGRTDHPILHAGSSLGDPAYQEMAKRYYTTLTYSSHSITRVLSSVDALLQSFLDGDNNTHEVVSNPLPTIVLLFQYLGDLDFHPSNIFPSVRLSSERLLPNSWLDLS